MRTLTSREAEQIARKLDAEVEEGRGHARAKIRWQGKIIASYGIRRASRDSSHDYIPKQIFVTFRQALDLARCPLEKDEYFKIIQSKGKLPL